MFPVVNVPLPLLAVLMSGFSMFATLTTTGLHSLGATYIEVGVGPTAVVTWPLLVTVLVLALVAVDVHDDIVGELDAAALDAIVLVLPGGEAPFEHVVVEVIEVLGATAPVW